MPFPILFSRLFFISLSFPIHFLLFSCFFFCRLLCDRMEKSNVSRTDTQTDKLTHEHTYPLKSVNVQRMRGELGTFTSLVTNELNSNKASILKKFHIGSLFIGIAVLPRATRPMSHRVGPSVRRSCFTRYLSQFLWYYCICSRFRSYGEELQFDLGCISLSRKMFFLRRHLDVTLYVDYAKNALRQFMEIRFNIFFDWKDNIDKTMCWISM